MESKYYHYLLNTGFTLCGKQRFNVNLFTNYDEIVDCPLCKSVMKKRLKDVVKF